LLGPALAAAWARRWSFVVGSAVGALGTVFLAYPLYALTYADYWRVLTQSAAALAPPGLELIQNQSIFGAMQKLAYRGSVEISASNESLAALTFTPLLAPGAARVLGFTCALAVVAVLSWALWRLDRRRADAPLIAWCVVLTSAMLLSPISWMLYTAIIAPVYPALLVVRRQLAPAWRLLIPLGYLAILWQRVYILWLPFAPWLPLTSMILLGILGWWLLFVQRAIWLPGPASQSCSKMTTHEQTIPSY
jgi:hypothetical protein